MAPTSTGPDAADLDLLEALKSHARVEVADLTARLGLSHRRIRLRMRRLERSGLIRGYHAVTAVPDTPVESPALAMLRFTAGPRPSVEELRKMFGVRRVYTLCSTWDVMIEFADGGQTVLGDPAPDRGVVELLGTRAEFEVLAVRREHLGSSGSNRQPSSVAPFLGLVHLLSVGLVVPLVLHRIRLDLGALQRRQPPILPQHAASVAG